MNEQPQPTDVSMTTTGIPLPHLSLPINTALETALRLPRCYGLNLSADGRYASWVVVRLDENLHQWSTELIISRLADGVIVARFPESGSAHWLAHSTVLAFSQTGTVTLFNPDSGDERRVPYPAPGLWIAGTCGDAVLLWQVRPRLPGCYHWMGVEAGEQRDLWWMPTDGRSAINLTAGWTSASVPQNFVVSPSGNALVMNASQAGVFNRPETWLCDLQAASTPPLWRQLEMPPLSTVVDWSPDGGELLLNHESSRTRWLTNEPYELWSIPAVGATFAYHRRAATGQQLLSARWTNQGILARMPIGTTAVMAVVGDGRFTPLDVGSRPVVEFASTRVGICVAIVLTSIGIPEILTGEPGHPLRTLATYTTGTPPEPFGHCEAIAWTAADGQCISGVLHRPWQAVVGPLPLIVILKGGPATNDLAVACEGLRQLAWPVPAYLAAGFLLLSVNYRGSSGHGQKFQDEDGAGRTVPGALALGDIAVGIDHLVGLGLADPTRVGCAGWSYGGFLAALAVGHCDRFRAVVVGAGVSDHAFNHLLSDHPEWSERLFGGSPVIDRRRYDEASPLTAIHPGAPPTLIQHGDRDHAVQIANAVALHHALLAHGVPCAFQRFPESGHAIPWEGPDAARAVAKAGLEWFIRHLLSGKQHSGAVIKSATNTGEIRPADQAKGESGSSAGPRLPASTS